MTDTPLKLFNSLTRSLEVFAPVHAGEARVYTCGPTVYNYPHIGNMRAYVFADVLGRTLSWKGYKLTHVINITDVGHLTDDADAGEDKMERMAAQAKKEGKAQSIWDIAEHYKQAYWADVKALNIRQPAQWTVATDYVPQMIEFAQGIAETHCYELESGLYFDVSTVADYGRLARAVTEDGEGRIDAVDGKRNPADFAIWRTTPPGETRQMEWDSPWGRGAPGWHLECSVMSGAVLGFPFDIHTGGIDHREIHHPNEIAQNQAHCCTNGLDDPKNSGARFWMHNNFLVERSGKMSKSSGEFLRLQLLIDRGYHPLAYRMMCLQAHYRSELEFSWEGLEATVTRLKRLAMSVENLRKQAPSTSRHVYDQLRRNGLSHVVMSADDWALAHVIKEFDDAISNDLNTPLAITILEGFLKQKSVSPSSRLTGAILLDEVLGLRLRTIGRKSLRKKPLRAEKDRMLTIKWIEQQLDRRRQAKSERDFELSDSIRDDLNRLGVEVMDGDPLGWEWKLS